MKNLPMDEIFAELFDAVFTKDSASKNSGTFGNKVRKPGYVAEGENQYIVVMDVPGCGKDDIKLVQKGNLLKVTATRKPTHVAEGLTAVVNNVPSEYTFEVPSPIAASSKNISANIRKGVLTITVKLPKENDKETIIEVK